MAKKQPTTFVLNDDSVANSYGFYIMTEGGDLSRFEANPVMLSDHQDSNEYVIGNWLNTRKEKSQLLAEPNFDTEDELGKMVAGKVERGFLKGCSMGIIPDWDSMVMVGDNLFLKRWELAEASIVPVPSNKNAIRLYNAEGKIMADEEVRKMCLSIQGGAKTEFNNPLNMKKILLSVQALMALGLTNANASEGVDSSEVEAKILELSGKVTKLEGEKSALELANKALKDTQDAATEKAATEMVTLAIAQGKIAATEKDNWINLAKTSPELAQSTLNAIPAKKSFATDLKVPGEAPTVKTMEEFQKLELSAQLAFKESDPEGYKNLFK